ncbi:MAG: carboxypeptidase-like regulatory domain-containing protein [Promethearchaeota archaeon]
MNNLGRGNYSWLFDPNSGGLYNFFINGSRSGFETKQIQFSILVRGDTNITIYVNNTETNYYQIYFDQNLNITSFYFNETNKEGIDIAICNITVYVNNSYYTMVNVGGGNYSWIFDAGIWYQEVLSLPFNYTMKINASAPGFQYHEKYITVEIKPKPTDLTIYMNDSISNEVSIYFNESIFITAFYNDTYLITGILEASVNITCISMFKMIEDVSHLGNYTYIFNAIEPGDLQFIINATKYGYIYAETIITIHVLNYNPMILDIKTNATASMYRNDTFMVNATIIDPEDSYPNLFAYLCLNLSFNTWYNSSLSYISNDFFALNFTIPNENIFLGFIQLYISANDSDGAIVEVLFFTIYVSNNLPAISSQQSNQTVEMFRSETIRTNVTVTDVEDVPPQLTVYLCISIPAGGWNNISMVVNGNFFEYNFTIPTSNDYLGSMEVIIRANDSNDGWVEVSMGFVEVKNNLPSIINPLSNHTSIMYRNDTIRINATFSDIEDAPPSDLTAYLCLNLSSSSWYNTSMAYLGSSFWELNWTIPDTDQFMGLIFLYLRINDTNGGVDVEFIDTIQVIGRPTNFIIYLNGSIAVYTEIECDQTINITAYFYEIQKGSSLIDANVNITCLTNPMVAQNTPMSNLGNGNYSWIFNAISGGQFIFVINGSRSGFQTKQIQLTISVKATANFTIYLNNSISTYYELYSNQILNITTYYFNETNGQGIDMAICNLTVFENNTLYTMINIGNGNYSWIFDASIWYQVVSSLPHDFMIKINGSAPNFQYVEKIITIRINSIPTNITIYFNNSVTNVYNLYYNESIIITSNYHENLSYYGIDGASVNISQIPMDEDLINTGNYTYIFNATQLGNFQLIVNATKYGYAYAETILLIRVIERPTGIKIFVNDIETNNTFAFYNESCKIMAYYYDVRRDVGIDSAIINLSNGMIYNLDPVATEQGNYTLIYNISSLTNLFFTINSSKYGYAFISSPLSISILLRPTNILAYFNQSQTYNYSLYFNQTLELIVIYYDIRLGAGISNAEVNLTINPIWPLNESPTLSGNYSFIYRTTEIGDFTLIVNASRYGCTFNSTIMQLHVLRRPIDLSINLNATIGNEITVEIGETIEIELSLKDNLTGQGIEGALVNISWNPSNIGYTDSDGNFTFIFKANESGEYILSIRVEKDGYVIIDQIVTISVKGKSRFNFLSLLYLFLVAGVSVIAVRIYQMRQKKKSKPKALKKKEEVVEKNLSKVNEKESEKEIIKEKESQEISDDIEEDIDATVKEKLNQIMKEAKTSYLNVDKIAEELGISAKEVQDLATQEGYRVTQKRIYKKTA